MRIARRFNAGKSALHSVPKGRLNDWDILRELGTSRSIIGRLLFRRSSWLCSRNTELNTTSDICGIDLWPNTFFGPSGRLGGVFDSNTLGRHSAVPSGLVAMRIFPALKQISRMGN